MGELDELNAMVGLLRCEALQEEQQNLLATVQHDLFDLGGELALPGMIIVTQAAVLRLDEAIAKYNDTLEGLKEFILPGGSRAAALAHVVRTVTRRAERHLVALSKQEDVQALALQYLNRLSDLMFVLARVFNAQQQVSDVFWKSERLKRNDAQES
jgi:cob(I)alamin adenosyltransferase